MGNEKIGKTKQRGVLDDVLVLDFTHVLSGPFASMMLADMGANVIKVERPGEGDMFRSGWPEVDGVSHQFAALNRSKYGITLDLRSPEGIRAAKELAKKADVVLNNFRPGIMEKLGLGPDVLRAENPKLIYASISGFGQKSSMSHLPAFDMIIQAMTGIMSLTGEADGPPIRAGLSWGDLVPGITAALAIVAALYTRRGTGEGCEIDVSMFDSLFYMTSYVMPYYLGSGRLPERTGAYNPTLITSGTYPASDGSIVVSGGANNRLWQAFARALEKPEWIDDPRFSTLKARQAHQTELNASICEIMRHKSRSDWEKRLAEHDVPSGPILNMAELAEFPLVKERNLLADLGYANWQSPANPFQMSGFSHAVRNPAPHLGADTRFVLGEMLGFSENEIDAAQGFEAK
jgi:crotonobetainyl-CoA:carnitine CoA-transferase CaiB-like acyl-CoA transferase